MFADSSSSATPQRTIYTVSKLNTAVRRLLESHFGQVWLVGEISNFSAPASGHWYFTLKDDQAQVRCAMFRQANVRVQSRVGQIGNGKQVLVRAKLGLYEPRGDYQLIVEHLEDAGIGLLQQKFDQLKARLQHEGLFDSHHKSPLPTDIKRIGVVTSATGAALQDVLAVLQRRDPAIEVIVYPAQVQGESAPAQLINALNAANRRNEVDVILLTRGGGSLEDLWSFNDETLARVVFTSRLPVVCAVGHEVDFSICDFVADIRAATPSAAAELLSRDRSHLRVQQQQLAQRLWRAWQQHLRHHQHAFALLQQRLLPLHPAQQLATQGQRYDELQRRLEQAVGRQLHSQHKRLQHTQVRLRNIHPQRQLAQANVQSAQLQARLERAIQQHFARLRQTMAGRIHTLQLVSPLQTLSRGYSITQDEQGTVIKDIAGVTPGTKLVTRVATGHIESQVTGTRAHNDAK